MKNIFITLILLITLVFSALNTNLVNFPLKEETLLKKYLTPFKTIQEKDETIREKDEKLNFLENAVSESVLERYNKYKNFKFDKNFNKLLHKEKNDIVYEKNIFLPYEHDLYLKDSLQNIEFKKITQELLSSKKSINISYNKFESSKNMLLMGANNLFPGSAFLEYSDNKLFLLSNVGIIGYAENNSNFRNTINFKQIKNNLGKFINVDTLKQKSWPNPYPMHWFGIKDLKIQKGKIYLSFTNEIKDNCWNISILEAELNYDNLIFDYIFKPNECVISYKNVKIEDFNAHQSGGRITFANNHLILSVGDFRKRHLAQKKNSMFGKILKIYNNKYEVISYGHRNPQGLFYDQKNDFIISTEHGPMGGDEINIIDLSLNNKKNYGWPISSYGEHYQGVINRNPNIYKKFPLLKSHSKYGFIEPIHAFVPSIGICEIIKYENNKYIASSLNRQSLYFFEINENKEIIDMDLIFIGERIRDIIINDDVIFMFLEDTASIASFKIN